MLDSSDIVEERRVYRCLFIVLLLAGVAVRIFGAWRYRSILNPDAGVVGLMAKHMAEGRGFPVFFYGQAYMGSLESAVSALFCRIFGCSGFAVCLGTALVGFLLLPVVYAWAKEAGGEKAGLGAMAYCVFGTGGYFHYMGSPRGGYAVTLLLGASLLWLSARIVFRERCQERQSWGWFFLLGLIAGLGWWTDQLAVPAILTAFSLMLLLGRKILILRALAAAVGFILGSLPFWVWNIIHDWGTFNFIHSFGRISFWRGFQLFCSSRLACVLDLYCLPPGWCTLAMITYLGAILIVFVEAGTRVRKHRKTQENTHILTIAGFWVIFALVFSTSHFAGFNTPRYLLPLLPALAVIIGLATVRLTRWLPFGLGWVPLILLIASQCVTLKPAVSWVMRGEIRKRMRDVQDLGDFLREHKVKIAYSRYRFYSRNFLLGEEFCFTSPNGDRYPPYTVKAEYASDIAVIRNCENMSAFLACAGGSASRSVAGDVSVHHDFLPPEAGLEEIRPQEWLNARNAAGESVMDRISDRNISTLIRVRDAWKKDNHVTISFTNPATLCAIRITNPWKDSSYPAILGVEGKETDNDAWKTIVSSRPTSCYYWSGTRFFWRGIHYRQECRFSPRTLSQVRILFPGSSRPPEWQISELQVFGPGPGFEPERSALPELTDMLAARGIDHLYSDRWAANAVARGMATAVLTEQEPHIRPRTESAPPNVVRLGPHTGFLTHREDARLCRDVLAGRGVTMRTTVIGPWVLFDFGPHQWRDEYQDDPSLYWAGFSCFFSDDKVWAATLIRRAERAYSRDALSSHVELLLEESVSKYRYKYAVDKLIAVCRETGNEEKATRLESQNREWWQPDIPADIRFRNGVRLLGISLSPQNVQRGGRLTAKYYWQCPAEVKNRLLAVFVHIKRNKEIFQDDHVFLEDFNVSCQPYPEVFVEKREMLVPRHIPAGAYSLNLGLCHRDTDSRRVKVKTHLPVRLDSVRMPLKIRIEPHKEKI